MRRCGESAAAARQRSAAAAVFRHIFFAPCSHAPLGQLPGQLQAASEAMLALEKKCRQSADSDSTLRVANALVQAAFDVNDLAALNSVLALLAKRRGQFKRVTLGVVNLAITMVERLPAKEAKLALIGTLRSITEGKMFVENERARLTRQLARMKEEEGDAAAASKLMQELQVSGAGEERLAFGGCSLVPL